jgi:DNA-binding GntR family transcriptional regulator
MSAGRDSSTPERIAGVLREDLLDGVLGPGARLTEESLTARFGSGRHSVRSALQILASEGLLEHRRNKGIVVPAVTAERIDTMCSYRLILELGGLRLALERSSDFAGVAAAVELLESLGPDASWRQVIEAHGAVHRQIVAAGGNDRLVRVHAACANELSVMLATIRADFMARRLAVLHRELLDDLVLGGDQALRALEDDLERGRATMHRALDRPAALSW